jgi:7-cyano-7-deazaguanine synthase in queuosine biosynthesis
MILLFSGGLDSYIAWHYLKRPRTLYCDLGHRYNYVEKEVVRNLIVTTHIDGRIELGDMEKEDAEIPLRNAFLLMVASYYDHEIAIVCQKGEQDIPDRTPQFLESICGLMSTLHGRSVRIINPFSEMTKVDMVDWYKSERLPVEMLYRTWSCYRPRDPDMYEAFADDLHCGACSACFRRWVAFACNGLWEEEYRNNILKYEGIEEYLVKMANGGYDDQRVGETLLALKEADYPDIENVTNTIMTARYAKEGVGVVE